MKNIYSTIFILAIFLNILAKNPKISGTYNSYREICEITNFSIQNNLLNIDSIIINNEHGGIDVFGGGKCPDNYVVDVLHLNKKAPRFAQFGQLNSYETDRIFDSQNPRKSHLPKFSEGSQIRDQR